MINANIETVLNMAEQKKASDIHFTVGRPPVLRIRGELIPIDAGILNQQDVKDICYSIMNEEQIKVFESVGQVDFSWAMPNYNRYRVNVFKQKNSCTAALRMISNNIPTFSEIGLPPIFEQLALKPRGLVLVTGPTGSGKSTTLAAMTGHINKNKRKHILTIEEPIEYLHNHDQSIVNQREVGSDTNSFAAALRAALREDPDVILVGEMRDLETISTAVSAAETGHFVMSTLHTTTAAQTVDRIIDSFDSSQQQQIRTQLAAILEGVICQQLIRTADKTRMVPAFEILLVNDAVRNLIREGKVPQIDTILQTNIKNGMVPMDYSLAQLVNSKTITKEDAFARCVDQEILKNYLNYNL